MQVDHLIRNTRRNLHHKGGDTATFRGRRDAVGERIKGDPDHQKSADQHRDPDRRVAGWYGVGGGPHKHKLSGKTRNSDAVAVLASIGKQEIPTARMLTD
jgi:hypothetical protein